MSAGRTSRRGRAASYGSGHAMPGNHLPILGVSDVMKLLVQQKREALREGLLGMGEMVVTALRQAIDCLRGRDLELAREIVVNDNKINQFRRLAEQQALVALAAYQPAGDDFREIGATLELVSELERMADHAKDVARLVEEMAGREIPPAPLLQTLDLAEQALAMLTGILKAYGDQDPQQALALAAQDDQVDVAQRDLIRATVALIQQDPGYAEVAIRLLWVAHDFERVADRALNIAEQLVFITTGQIPELE